MGKIGESFEELVKIMETLRGPGGCEWDREQTHESLKPYLIEEAYELINAIDNGNVQEMKEELGDVLLQVVFHAQIAKEEGSFDILDVIETLNEKLIRRHPHVFGDSPGYSYQQWERIKSQEKNRSDHSRIGDIDSALPSLSLARRIQENASAVGFDWEDAEGVMEKIIEELKELERAREKGKGRVEEELGDLLFSLVNLSRFFGVDPEKALRKSTEKFVKRFKLMEKMLEEDGMVFEEAGIDILDKYWEKAKEAEKT
ncbi:MAG: tetrapyrrole methylase family protein / MazG family protein [Thermotogota bacterium]|nr:tetrapyrrole methylase family protein / MazG family protein [Thermotogota bacterium]MDK2865264.1 tetrapyrrole methylase family protein / MazG family protein [Thermotogota bacterium]HCZ06777.1 nucleoside triphosphate pyrophosphohydrolase [Thermotogota bacterium]